MQVVLNDLLNYNGYKIYQRNDGFNFSLDSILLANFATVNKQVRSIVDLGCGNAPIPMVLTTKTDAKIIGVDIQEVSCELAKKSIEYNGLEDNIKILNMDLKGIHLEIGHDKFDLVTSNPPYFKVEENSKINKSELKTIARHEICVTIDDIIYSAKTLLRNNGYFALVHRPERLIEILEKFKLHRIEPKRIRFIYPKINGDANLVLIEGRKNGNSGLKIEPPLYTHKENGEYSDEVLKMFNG